MKKHIAWFSLMMLILCQTGFSQQQTSRSKPSHKYRTIFAVLGGAGGFALGLTVGLSVFDDAVYSERKVTTTAIVSGAAGAVAGYFLGRVLDNRNKQTTREMSPQFVRDSSVASSRIPDFASLRFDVFENDEVYQRHRLRYMNGVRTDQKPDR